VLNSHLTDLHPVRFSATTLFQDHTLTQLLFFKFTLNLTVNIS
jgi:hypothetical protein